MALARYKNREIRLRSYNSWFNHKPASFLTKIEASAEAILPSGGVLGNAASKATADPIDRLVVLVGPRDVDVSINFDNGKEVGLATNFLQPWHASLVSVSVSGESYLGMYEGLSVADYDVQNLANIFMNSLREFTPNNGAQGTQERIVLELPNNPAPFEAIVGYPDGSFRFKEDISKPYLLSYSFNFVGYPASDVCIKDGNNAGREAAKGTRR